MAQLLEFYRNFQSQKTPKPTSSSTSAPSPRDSLPDEELTEIERIVRYCKSSGGLQRLIHVKILADAARTAGYEDTRKYVIPILETLSSDPEPLIRQHLCFQITAIAKFCASSGEQGYQVAIEIILPVIAHLLEDEKPEIRQAAGNALISYSGILTSLDLGQHVLTIVLQLAHDDLNEDMRVTAIELLNSLAVPLGDDLCRQFIIPEVISLIEDPSFLVRRSIALNFFNICKMSGEYELFEKLMPGFVKLSKDDIFRVRRACAECLYDIARFVDLDIKVGVLVEIFLRLAEDPSIQVKEILFFNAGKFISTLPSRVINKAILSHYLSLLEGPLGDMPLDSELQVACAYSFPGVLYAMEKERWPELRILYHNLVNSANVKIRKTLAASLHEVGRILGPVTTEEELMPVFEELIQDVEPVRMGVIKYFSSLIELLSIPCRVSYVPVLRDILLAASPFNWRLRQMIASQFRDLVVMLPIQNLYATLFPLAITLIQDRIAEVRYSILPGITKMILVVLPGYQPSYLLEEFTADGTVTHVKPPPVSENDITFLEAIVLAINALIVSDAYIYRQIWCELVGELLMELPLAIFEKYFFDGIVQLTADPITNVRVKVAELLTKWEKYGYSNPWEEEQQQQEQEQGTLQAKKNPWKWLLAQEQVQRCVERLSRDDRDVYRCLRKIQPLFPTLEFEEISCRGLKTAPGIALMVPSPEAIGAGAPVKMELGNREDDTAVAATSVSFVPDHSRHGHSNEDTTQEMETESTMTIAPPSSSSSSSPPAVPLSSEAPEEASMESILAPVKVPVAETTKAESEESDQNEIHVPPSPPNEQETERKEATEREKTLDKTEDSNASLSLASLTVALPPPLPAATAGAGLENGENEENGRLIVAAQLSDLIANIESNASL